MRYFTPERWLRLQNVEDERAFDAAQAEWEAAIAGYNQDLQELAPRLPRTLRRFAETECLHDATLLANWLDKGRLYLLLRTEQPNSRLLRLGYTLVGQETVSSWDLPPTPRPEHARWMYDEVGLMEGRHSEPVFTHSILLGDGREITLCFEHFSFSRLMPGLPANEQPPAEVRKVKSKPA